MIQFFEAIVQVIYTAHENVVLTTQSLNAVNLSQTEIVKWLGHARYVMGDPLYIAFTAGCLISTGFALYKLILQGISAVRQICKF